MLLLGNVWSYCLTSIIILFCLRLYNILNGLCQLNYSTLELRGYVIYSIIAGIAYSVLIALQQVGVLSILQSTNIMYAVEALVTSTFLIYLCFRLSQVNEGFKDKPFYYFIRDNLYFMLMMNFGRTVTSWVMK
eukprot:Awhi_evm2s3362